MPILQNLKKLVPPNLLCGNDDIIPGILNLKIPFNKLE